MKTAFKTGSGSVTLRDIELRETGINEIRLKVDVCGICGTELHKTDSPKESKFGHEVAGTVIEVGTAVDLFQPGDNVVLDSSTPCGSCDNCHNGRQELCTNIQSIFHIGSFGFAEEMLAPAISGIHYDGLTPEVACLQEPLGVAIDVFKLADISIDSNVLVIGAGPIGLMAAALARRAGARKVFVSDFANRCTRMKYAEKIGIDAWHDPSVASLESFDFGCGINRIIVTAPPIVLPGAFDVAVKGAIIAFIGIGGENFGQCTFDADRFHFKKLQLRASFASPALYGPLALRYLKEGVVDGDAMISHEFGLDNIAEAMNAAASPEALKVIVRP